MLGRLSRNHRPWFADAALLPAAAVLTHAKVGVRESRPIILTILMLRIYGIFFGLWFAFSAEIEKGDRYHNETQCNDEVIRTGWQIKWPIRDRS